MPELPTTVPAPAPRARRRAGASARASLAEVLDLAVRAARVPDGLALLEGAPLECVAVLLGVEPGAIERARATMEEPAVREEAARRYALARAGERGDGAAATPPAPPRDPGALLLAARERADGLGVLFSASPEAAAITFGVHPALVLRAREAAAPGRPGDDALGP